MTSVRRRPTRVRLSEASIPALLRHARLKFDNVRDRWVLLVPERVMVPDETAVEILNLCDGRTDIAAMIDALCAKYTAERELIGNDVIALLQDLADQGYVADLREKTA